MFTVTKCWNTYEHPDRLVYITTKDMCRTHGTSGLKLRSCHILKTYVYSNQLLEYLKLNDELQVLTR